MLASNILKQSHTFRRWSRTPYAVFNSLRAEVRIGVLALACIMLTMPGKTTGKDSGSPLLAGITSEEDGDGGLVTDATPLDVISDHLDLQGVLFTVSGNDCNQSDSISDHPDGQGVLHAASGSAADLMDSISDHLDLKGVVVSAQRTPVLQSDLMRSVQVISSSEILRSPSPDVAGLLQYVRGVDIRKRGGFGVQADVGIRGGTFDQTMVLLNGVNITDPQTGHHNLNIPVDIHSIERIEVLRGSAARLFGPNAFSGAINIITSQPGSSGFTTSLSGGQNGYGNLSLSGGWSMGKTEHHLSLSGMTSDGYRHNTDFNTANAYYQGLFDLGGVRLDAQAGYHQKAFGANGFYSPRFPDQFEETKTGFISFGMVPVNVDNLSFNTYWRRHSDRFELFRHEAPEWYQNHNHHLTDVAGFASNYSIMNKLGQTSLGVDYRFEHIYSNVLGEPMQSIKAVAGYDDADYTHSFERSGFSMFAEHTAFLGSFSISGGVLAYLNAELDKRFSLFPGIDIGWELNQHWRWYSSMNRTLRLPTFTDLFYSGPTNLGNPDLQPERATSLETGVKGMHGILSVEVTAYRRWGRQMIDWVRYPSDELWLSMNHTTVNTSGVEAYLDIPLRTLPGNPLLNLQYMFTYIDKQSDEYVSNYTLDHLRHKVDMTLNVNITRRLGGRLLVSWRDRAGAYLLYADGAFQQMQPFEPHWLADVRIHYGIKRFRLFVDGTNLLNTHYTDIANLPQAGRWVVAGIMFKSALDPKAR